MKYGDWLYTRIIPARAGVTDYDGLGWVTKEDHPRSRGVYRRTVPVSDSRAGSSPLARGLLLRTGSLGLDPGIIPARAGFTDDVPTNWAWNADHPRSRGVYPICVAWAMNSCGSSPLARGLHLTPGVGVDEGGIIPARAGFTG